MDTGEPNFYNRYASAFSDPTNLTDPTGMAPGDRFATIDEAAVDLLEYAAKETRENDGMTQKERGGDIKADGETGEFYYNDPLDVGTNDEIHIGINDDTVGVAHTHPESEGGRGLEDSRNDRSNNGEISSDDRKMVKDIKRHIGKNVPTYVGTSDGSITKFTKENKNYRRGETIKPKGFLKF